MINRFYIQPISPRPYRANRQAHRHSSRRGLAQRDVALIVASICLLLAIVVPYIYRQRTLQRRRLCEARQYRTALAVIQTSMDRNQIPGYRVVQSENQRGELQASSWVFAVLPYLHPLDTSLSSLKIPAPDERLPVQKWGDRAGPINDVGPFETLARAHGPDGMDNQRGIAPDVYIPMLICPSDAPVSSSKPGAETSFVANCGMPDVRPTKDFPADWRENGVFLDQFPGEYKIEKPINLEFIEDHDGLSHVLMLSENVDAGKWTDTEESKIGFVFSVSDANAPQSLDRSIWDLNSKIGKGKGGIESARPSSRHMNGFNVARCDGASQFIQEKIDEVAWAALMMTDSEAARYPGEVDGLLPALYRHGDENESENEEPPMFDLELEKPDPTK